MKNKVKATWGYKTEIHFSQRLRQCSTSGVFIISKKIQVDLLSTCIAIWKSCDGATSLLS